MKTIMHHIRRQPEKVRRHILHGTIVFFAVVLISLWVYSLGTTLANPETQAKLGQDVQPLSALKDNLVGGYNSLTSPGSDTANQAQ